MESEVVAIPGVHEGLPQGWRWLPLAEVADNLDNKRKPINAAERETRKGDVPYYGATGQVGWIDKHLLDEEVVLVGEDGAPFLEPGRPKAYMISGKSWVNNHAHILRARDGMPNAYLMHFLNILDYSPYVTGTTRLKLTKGAMNKIPVPVAPLPQQRRIVEAIELQLGRLDAAVARLHAAKAKLKRYKQAVLKAAFEIDCERLSTNDVTELITDGDHQAPPQVAEGVPFIVISNVKNNEVDFSVTKYVPEAYYNALSVKRKPRVGDVLYTVTGSYGIPVLVSDERPFCFQRHIALLRPNAKVLAAYLYLWLQTPDAMTQAKDVATGTAQMTVPLKGLRAFELPVPRLSEQKAIVRDVASRLERMTETNATLDAQLLQSTRLRQAVLKRAFEGRLV